VPPRLVLLLALVVAGAGCGGSHRSDRALFPDVPHFVRPGAPHPLACTADDDCVPAAGVNPDEGCCTTGVPTTIASHAWTEWYGAWARAHCATVRCPPRPPPAPLLPCGYQGRCANGRCTSRCP
jgi:hypothetical protein